MISSYDCNGTGAQKWSVQPGSTKVQLAGTNFCLDAGSKPGNGIGMKIYQCYANLPAQQWFLTQDDRIALEGQGLCLDDAKGSVTNGAFVQTWQCGDNNSNQVWTLGSSGPTSSAPPSSAPPSSTTMPPPTSTPKPFIQLHPNGNKSKCVDVRGGVVANGTPVQIYDCNGTGAQNWVVQSGSTKVQLAGTNFCLDAGSAPANGIGMKIWTCFDNLPAQQWYYTGDLRVAVEGKGQCLDLTNGNLANSNQLQTWQCTDGNTNQIWTQ
ncbi:hypothetical protein ONZ45_g2708 [Pleurotus djamor]|nr:hypothetical protein ONZ45_g2708 [Pleurotus djamor]